MAQSAKRIASKIPNHKLQIPISNDQKDFVSNLGDWDLFEIWCLGFGAYHLPYALCSMLYAILFSTNSVISIALIGISFLRAVVRMVRTHCWHAVITVSVPVAWIWSILA